MAEKHNYEIAEKMIEVEGGGQLDPTRQKIVTDLVKEQGKFSVPYYNYNYRQHPYEFRSKYQHQQQQFYNYPQSFLPQHSQSQLQPAQLALALGKAGSSHQYPVRFSAPPFTAHPTRGRGGKEGFDKSRYAFFACQLVGHWAGDQGCPQGVMDPRPTGTG